MSLLRFYTSCCVVALVSACGVNSQLPEAPTIVIFNEPAPLPAEGNQKGIVPDSDGQTTRNPAKSHGTGILLNTEGDILTAAHVLTGCQSINVVFNKNVTVSATPHVLDEALDLAVLKSSLVKQAPAILTRDVATDKLVGIVAGYPKGQDYKIVPAVVDYKVYKPGEGMIGLDGDVQLGNSGGPFANEQGYVLGIIKSKIDTLAYLKQTGQLETEKGLAIDVAQVENFLKTAQVNAVFKQDVPKAKNTLADLSKATVKIDCLD